MHVAPTHTYSRKGDKLSHSGRERGKATEETHNALQLNNVGCRTTKVYTEIGIANRINNSNKKQQLFYFAVSARLCTILLDHRIVLRTGHCVTVQSAGLHCPAQHVSSLTQCQKASFFCRQKLSRDPWDRRQFPSLESWCMHTPEAFLQLIFNIDQLVFHRCIDSFIPLVRSKARSFSHGQLTLHAFQHWYHHHCPTHLQGIGLRHSNRCAGISGLGELVSRCASCRLE